MRNPRVVFPFSVERTRTVSFLHIERRDNGAVAWGDVSGEIVLSQEELAAVIAFLQTFIEPAR